jgi:hypothetical protein
MIADFISKIQYAPVSKKFMLCRLLLKNYLSRKDIVWKMEGFKNTVFMMFI